MELLRRALHPSGLHASIREKGWREMTHDEEIALLHAMYGSFPDRRDVADYNPNTMLEENRWLWRHVNFLQACLVTEQRSRRWWRCCAVAVAALLIVVVWARLA